MKTTIPKENEVKHAWVLVDAAGKPCGRLAVTIANLLRGRGKPDYTPHIDMGDFVVVVNADKVKLTGRKEQQKQYAKYTRYQSGYKLTSAADMRQKHPEYIIEHAVKNMLPANHLSRQLFKRLKVYPGGEHPHAVQNPQPASA